MTTLTSPKYERQVVGFRFPLPLLKRIDARAQRSGLSRTATVMALVSAGLECAEAGHPVVLRDSRAA